MKPTAADASKLIEKVLDHQIYTIMLHRHLIDATAALVLGLSIFINVAVLFI